MSNNIGVSFSSSATGKSGWSTGGLGDLYSTIEGLGRPIYVNNNPSLGVKLGGGITGLMPQPLSNDGSTFARTRYLLRDAWNTSSHSGSSNVRRMVGSFRAVNNAGDLLCRQNYACGGGSQTFSSRPGLKGLGMHFGSTSQRCNPSALYSTNQVDPSVPSSTCNVKFVYDSSDFTRFKKNQAINRNYNDMSFGGDMYNASQSAKRSIVR
jgi:hypothetical protein